MQCMLESRLSNITIRSWLNRQKRKHDKKTQKQNSSNVFSCGPNGLFFVTVIQWNLCPVYYQHSQIKRAPHTPLSNLMESSRCSYTNNLSFFFPLLTKQIRLIHVTNRLRFRSFRTRCPRQTASELFFHRFIPELCERSLCVRQSRTKWERKAQLSVSGR